MSAPDTIVLVHGFWVTPRSWEEWQARFEERGFRVVVPAYPGFEVEVEALNADPTPVQNVTIDGIVDHFTEVVSALDTPPIIMGHSAGGVFTQILLDRGYGAAGVALNSAPTEGVPIVPLSQIKATFPVLKNPANRNKAIRYDFEQWNYAFTNTCPEDDARRLYERYAVPVSGHILFESALANLTPGHGGTYVDYHNADRAPLLFIAGGADHIMPPAVNKANAEKYEKSGAHTDYHVFEGRDHFTCGAPGWEAVAHYALTWAEEHAPLSARKPSVEAPS